MRCRIKCYKRNGIVLVHAVERSHIKMWIDSGYEMCVNDVQIVNTCDCMWLLGAKGKNQHLPVNEFLGP